MKSIILKLSLLSALTFLSIGCSEGIIDPLPEDDKDVEGKPGKEDEKKYELVSEQTYNLTAFIGELTEESDLTSGLPDIYKQMVTARLNSYVTRLEGECGVEKGKLGFKKIVYLYKSKDQYDKDVVLSAMAMWFGQLEGDVWEDSSPSDVCLMEHYTITSNAECPSEGYPFEAFVNGNALVIMPDYIGFGHSSDMVHPYLNHEVCAVNSMDALWAGMDAFDDVSEADLDNGWTMFVRGASQGGGNALAVHKYIDSVPGMADKCRFSHSYCAAGPYDPALTVDRYMEAGLTENPVLFTLTLKSMHDSYPDILGRFDEDRMYSDKYLTYKDELESALSSKDYTTSQLNRLYIKTLAGEGAGRLTLSDILSEEILTKESELSRALYECLELNDLTKGWTPSHPIELFYSELDEIVPYENAMAVYNAFGDEFVKLTRSLIQTDHSIACALWMLDLISR